MVLQLRTHAEAGPHHTQLIQQIAQVEPIQQNWSTADPLAIYSFVSQKYLWLRFGESIPSLDSRKKDSWCFAIAASRVVRRQYGHSPQGACFYFFSLDAMSSGEQAKDRWLADTSNPEKQLITSSLLTRCVLKEQVLHVEVHKLSQNFQGKFCAASSWQGKGLKISVDKQFLCTL